VAFACLLLAVAISASFASAPAGAAGSQARLLVKFRAGTSAQFADRQLENAGARPATSIQQLGIRVVTVASTRAREAAKTLRSSSRVEFVEDDSSFEPQDLMPSDPSFPTNFPIAGGAWGWTKTRTTQAWEITRGDPSVLVAVLDTGLKTGGLTDFDGQVVPGWNVVSGSSNTSASAGNHGTYVAGVVGLGLDNALGNAGYCPGCRIMPVQIGSDSGATLTNMAKGITWAVDHGARVLNLSWAGTSSSSTLTSAVSYARSRGAVVVAAAGNSNCNCATYPSATPGVLGVAGTTQADQKQNDSNYGAWVALAAPESNLTAWPSINGAPGYAPVGGTSMAAPVVAAIAGLLFSAKPSLTGGEVEQALQSSAVPVGFTVQHGSVDALAALAAVGLVASDPSRAPLNRTEPAMFVQTNGEFNYTPLLLAPRPGDVLIRGQGSWEGSAPLSLSAVRWERCNSFGCAVAGSAAKYTVQATDAGFALRLAITVKNAAGSTTALSPLSAVVGGGSVVSPPQNTSPPTTTGTARDSETLVASPGVWSGSPAYSYQWQRCDASGAGCAGIPGATASSYLLTASDVGATVRVQVTAANSAGASVATSAPTAVVEPPLAEPPPPPPAAGPWVFSSSLNPKNPSRTFSVSVGDGAVRAELSFSRCKSMNVALKAAGSTIRSANGPSVVVLGSTVAAGSYDFEVSGERCSFTLTVTASRP
jgi:subtilisin family serine protease